MPDYLAVLRSESEDALHYGVKGQKWGVRRSSGELKVASTKREPAPAAKKPATTSAVPDGSETSSARYSRLAAQAKSGKASEMSTPDLQFFNSRTEALAKVNKLTQSDPNWLAKTTKTVLQNAAQKELQNVADSLARKYIGDRILPSPSK